jgi:hypothetical protein
MTPQISTPAPALTTTFTPEERQALCKLRTRYQQDADLLSQKELRICASSDGSIGQAS